MIMRLLPSVLAGVLAAAQLFGSPVRAETGELRITKQPSIIYMPLVLMEQQKLVEKHAAAAGLGDLKVSWTTFSSGGAATEALLSGNVDLVTSGATNLLLLWARTRGEVKGVTGAAATPLLLVSRNPEVKTLKDFTAKDKIAVPTVKVSTQAIILQMASEREFGEAGRNRLDGFTITMGHPDAMVQVLNPSLEVNSHFSAPPYQYEELRTQGVHLVLDSSDVMGGPASNAVVFGRGKFHDANPKTLAAFRAALDEATKLIEKDRKAAAEVYLSATKERYTADELAEMMGQKNMIYSATPYATMKFAEFMHKVGLIKEKPGSWKDIFFADVHNLPGS
jgi:NitT/TauT family transport system substrate-binding protein